MGSSRDSDGLDAGTPGASARREHQRRQSNREQRTRDKHPRIGGLLLAVQEAPRHERMWQRGADGEAAVARSLAKRCGDHVVVLHDRRMPCSGSNIDHLAVAASGVWVIDSKRYKGKVAISRPLFGEAKLTIAGRDQSKLAGGLAKQVEAVEAVVATLARGVPVRGALCFVDAELPLLRTLVFEGYPLLYPRQLAKRLNAGGPLPPAVPTLATALARHCPPA